MGAYQIVTERVEKPVACLVVTDGRGTVIAAAPYLRKFVGQPLWRLRAWFKARHGPARQCLQEQPGPQPGAVKGGPTMQPFNPEATCRKCGGEDIASRFCRAVSWASYEHQREKFDAADYQRDHIHRYCRRCHFTWLEAPLDGAPATTGDDEKETWAARIVVG